MDMHSRQLSTIVTAIADHMVEAEATGHCCSHVADSYHKHCHIQSWSCSQCLGHRLMVRKAGSWTDNLDCYMRLLPVRHTRPGCSRFVADIGQDCKTSVLQRQTALANAIDADILLIDFVFDRADSAASCMVLADPAETARSHSDVTVADLVLGRTCQCHRQRRNCLDDLDLAGHYWK